jgi:alkylation response protein AidB-like acyl-CoA dehydrogenase
LVLSRLGEHREFAVPLLERMGELAAREIAPLAGIADREQPRLESFDARGVRVDHVDFHPAYRRMEELSYGEGLVSLKYDPEVRRRHGAVVHTLGFAMSYLFAQAECGLFCPLCMTDGAARVLSLHAPADVRDELLPRLTTKDVSRLYTGAMFLTEIQGGSDVGATSTRAVPDGDAWRLSGRKWFCSNVNAQVILTLARPDGAESGTSGLGLFVIVRDPAAGGAPLDGFRIDRLKPKLGVRSMATGEVTLESVRARLIAGPPRSGFRAMSDMINLSRLYNSLGAVACVRRGLYEAGHHARERQAFGRRLVDHPLQAQVLAMVASRHRSAMYLVFDAIGHVDAADAGDDERARRARLLVPLAKYHTGGLTVWGCSQCLEAVGGNGYIEEFPLARLLRDAQVLPIWEGSSNIQLLDILRVLRKERAHDLLGADIRARLESASGAGRAAAGAARRAEAELAAVSAGLERAAASAAADAPPADMRNLADRLAWLYGISGLLGGPDPEPQMAELLLAAGPGLGEGSGPWRAVPDGFAREVALAL